MFRDEHVVVARRGRLPARTRPLAELDGRAMVAQPPICDQAVVEAALARAAVAPDIVFRTEANQGITSMVRAGLGAAVMPVLSVWGQRHDDALSFHRLEPAVPDRVVQVVSRGTLSPLAIRLRELSVEAGQQLVRDLAARTRALRVDTPPRRAAPSARQVMMSAVTDAPTTSPAPQAGLRAWLRDLGAVVAQGARLWVRTWPLLLVIALLAVAGRHAAGWAAVNVSAVNNTLGWAVLVLAPLSMVAGIVAMLHVLRRDLPALRAIGRTRAPRRPDLRARARTRRRAGLGLRAVPRAVRVVRVPGRGPVAVPQHRRVPASSGSRPRSPVGTAADGSFVDLATGWGLVALVVGAVVLRWLLGRWEGRSHRRALAFAGAYVEAFWLLVVAAFATQLLDRVWDWIETRRAVAIVLEWWLTVLDALGPVAGPVDAAVNAVAGVLGNLDDLVVIPLAWLTVGAVVYGHKLAAPPSREPQGAPRGLAAGAGAGAPVDHRGGGSGRRRRARPFHGAGRRAAPARDRGAGPDARVRARVPGRHAARGGDPAARPCDQRTAGRGHVARVRADGVVRRDGRRPDGDHGAARGGRGPDPRGPGGCRGADPGAEPRSSAGTSSST